jgi:hypothetical protein
VAAYLARASADRRTWTPASAVKAEA